MHYEFETVDKPIGFYSRQAYGELTKPLDLHKLQRGNAPRGAELRWMDSGKHYAIGALEFRRNGSIALEIVSTGVHGMRNDDLKVDAGGKISHKEWSRRVLRRIDVAAPADGAKTNAERRKTLCAVGHEKPTWRKQPEKPKPQNTDEEDYEWYHNRDMVERKEILRVHRERERLKVLQDKKEDKESDGLSEAEEAEHAKLEAAEKLRKQKARENEEL